MLNISSRAFGQLVLGTLRAMGQVAFANNAVSGLIIFIGCLIGNPPRAGGDHCSIDWC